MLARCFVVAGVRHDVGGQWQEFLLFLGRGGGGGCSDMYSTHYSKPYVKKVA